jgi:hypothetical protein
MKTMAFTSGGTNVISYPIHPGVSSYAALIRNELDKINQNFTETISFGDHLAQTIEGILLTKDEHSRNNWDAYGAKAINPQSFSNSLLFALSLPSEIPIPEIDAVPNGLIVFIWNKGNRSIFSVIIGNRSELYYAGLFGVSRIHGVEYFNNSVPEVILTNITKVYIQE